MSVSLEAAQGGILENDGLWTCVFDLKTLDLTCTYSPNRTELHLYSMCMCVFQACYTMQVGVAQCSTVALR